MENYYSNILNVIRLCSHSLRGSTDFPLYRNLLLADGRAYATVYLRLSSVTSWRYGCVL